MELALRSGRRCDRGPRAREHREECVTFGADLDPLVRRECGTEDRAVELEELFPTIWPEGLDLHGRSLDVGEEHRDRSRGPGRIVNGHARILGTSRRPLGRTADAGEDVLGGQGQSAGRADRAGALPRDRVGESAGELVVIKTVVDVSDRSEVQCSRPRLSAQSDAHDDRGLAAHERPATLELIPVVSGIQNDGVRGQPREVLDRFDAPEGRADPACPSGLERLPDPVDDGHPGSLALGRGGLGGCDR